MRIRKAEERDVHSLHSLIRALAHYERAEDQVSITVEELQRDGFGPSPIYRALVAEHAEHGVIGMAIYYERYSTWKGATLYLEDLVVSEEYRGMGVGSSLLQELIELTREGGYKRLEWQVLDWNSPAIEFYEKVGAQLDAQWLNCRMEFNEGL